MKFTPFSIKNQEFSRTVRGFDRDEVKAYLEQLSDEVERLQAENSKLNAEIEKMNSQMEGYRRIEKNLQSTLLSAQESSSKAVESAKKQTALLIKESELKAAQIIEEAKEKANDIRDAVLKLREEKNLLVAKLRAMVDTQSHLLESSFRERIIEETEVDFTSAKKDIDSKINADEILEKLL
ncbi:MAG: DivIVA domain-containing protein [Melioribacteraceae bacterium]|nr:DivIVA domain-containing protein [Melioribacteraceae bacterium]